MGYFYRLNRFVAPEMLLYKILQAKLVSVTSYGVNPVRSSAKFSAICISVREFAYGSWVRQYKFCAQILTEHASYACADTSSCLTSTCAASTAGALSCVSAFATVASATPPVCAGRPVGAAPTSAGTIFLFGATSIFFPLIIPSRIKRL